MVRVIRKKGTRNRPAGYLARTREQMLAAARMASQDPDPPVVPESELSTQADEPQPPANEQLQDQEQLPRNGEEVRQVEQASVDPAAVQAQYAHAMEAVVEAGQQEGGAVAYVDQQDQQPAEGAPHLEEASARDAAVPAGLAPGPTLRSPRRMLMMIAVAMATATAVRSPRSRTTPSVARRLGKKKPRPRKRPWKTTARRRWQQRGWRRWTSVRRCWS